MPDLLVVAGPNGSGKSTLVRALGLSSIDPDRLALEHFGSFTPTANLSASRLALTMLDDALSQRRDVAQETTLAGAQPLRVMASARTRGYRVSLVYVTTQDDTRLRIDTRVALGGHDIPDVDLHRRPARILQNLPRAASLADVNRHLQLLGSDARLRSGRPRAQRHAGVQFRIAALRPRRAQPVSGDGGGRIEAHRRRRSALGQLRMAQARRGHTAA